MIVYVGSDHRGYDAKSELLAYLQAKQLEVVDVGDKRLDPNDDFPVFAARAVAAVKSSSDNDPRAILVCGSGQGMVIAANRYKGIRAGLGWSVEAARAVRNDEDSNVLALPAEFLDNNKQLALAIVDTFLETPFANAPRYVRRNKELDELA